MATLEQLTRALENADKAGDKEAAQVLAAEIKRVQTPSIDQAMSRYMGGGGQKPGFLESFARGAAQGATLGSGDEMYAAGAGALAKAKGEDFVPAFQKQLAETQGNNKAASEANPWTYTAGNVAGAIPGLIAGGATNLGAKALGLVGKNIFTRSAASAGSGAALGAVGGFAGTDGDLADRTKGASNSAAWGGAFGLGGPIVGQAIGTGARAIGEALMPGRSLPAFAGNKDIARLLSQDVQSAGGAQAAGQRLGELGPDAMLLDASPSFMGRAQGLATQPESREAITAPLKARNAQTNARLQGDVNQTLGPAPIAPQVERGLGASRDALSPDYTRVMQGAQAVDNAPLAQRLDAAIIDTRGRAQRVMREVREMLNIPGNAAHLDPNPNALLSSRKAIDGMLETEVDSNVIRALTMARREIDDELTRAVPGIKDVDAQFAELSRQSEALTRGGQVLKGGTTAIHPQELALELQQGVQPQGTMVGPSAAPQRLRQGVRADIDNVLGNRANDLEAVRQIVKGDGDWNRAKLAQMFGNDQANRIFNSVDREMAFRDAYNKIVENSQTAMRNEAAAAVRPRGATSDASSEVGPVVAAATGGPAGAAMALGVRGVRAANNQVMNAADIERNQQLARLLIGNNPQQNIALLQAAERFGRGDKRIDSLSEASRRIAQMLMANQGDNARRNTPDKFQIR